MTKMPIHQSILKVLGGMLVGLFAMGQFLDGISNAMTLITFNWAFWGTITITGSYLLLTLLLKKRKLKWKTKDGQLVTLIQLRSNIFLPMLGIVALFWIAVMINYNKNYSPSINVKIFKPIFDSSDTRFKILVLPFDKECDYQGTKYDIGKVICKRLEVLNNQDTLNLITHYYTDSLNLMNFNKSDADSIMKYNNANQIIFGSYSLKQCEIDFSDKVCFNYLTDKDKWGLNSKRSKTDYQMIDMSGIDALRNGLGQEEIEYVIYTVAAIAALNEKHFESAIHNFKKIKNFEGYDGIGHNIGFCYFKLNDYTRAKLYFEKALKINKNNDAVLNNLGVVSMESSLPKAKDYFERALLSNPENNGAYSSLGTVFLLLNNLSESKKCFQKAVEINPKDYNSWYNLGTFYSMSSENIKSKEAFEKAIYIAPYDSLILLKLGEVYNNLKDYKKAQECFENGVKLYPKNAAFRYNLGFTHLSLKDYIKAKKYYEETLNIDPSFDLAWNDLGIIYSNYRDNLKEKECYENAIKINSNSYKPWGNLGSLYLNNFENYPMAIKCFTKSFEITPKRESAMSLAVIYSRLKNKVSTLFYLRKAINIDASIKSNLKSMKEFEWLKNDKQFSILTSFTA